MKQKHPKETQPNGAAEHLRDGDWESCYQTAERLYTQGDYREAFSWYEKASMLPDCNPIVFFELGYLFQHGEGVDSDNIEALKWYEKAASFGVPQAMYNLAYFYQNGLVVDQDIQRAARLLRDATLLMDRLQLERSSYDAWKAEYEARLSEAERDAEEKRIRAESAEDALRKERETRKESEFKVSTRQAQMEERLRASEELVTSLAKEHNESFERVQSAYTSQVEQLQKAYETDFAALQKANERFQEQNSELSQALGGKTAELAGVQDALQQLQIRFGQELKMKRIAFALASLFGVLALIFVLL